MFLDAGPRRLLRVITPPTTLGVTLDEAKAHLRVEDNISDALISGFISAAQDQLAYVGRAFAPTTYALDLDFLPFRVGLPVAPVSRITAIKATDSAGTQTTLSTGLYNLFVRASGIGEVRLAAGQSWPPIRGDLGSASIEFTAGYDTGALAPGLHAAVLLIVAQLYSTAKSDLLLQQETVIGVSSQTWDRTGQIFNVYGQAIDSLVAPLRVP